MNVVEWLERIELYDDLIKSKQLEYDEALELAANTTSKAPDGMPFSNSGQVSDKVGNGAVDLATLAQEKLILIDKYTKAKEEAIGILEQLPANEYKVLYRKYILYMTWENVARDINYSYSQVRRIKLMAYEHLAELLRAKEKGGQL